MEMGLTTSIIGLAVMFLINAITTGFWAGKISQSLTNVNTNLSRIDRELEKRDVQIGALWKRVDELRDMIPNSQGERNGT